MNRAYHSFPDTSNVACVWRIKVPLNPTLPQAVVDTIGIPLLQSGLDLILGTLKVSSIVAKNFNRWTSSANKSCKGLNK